MDVVCRRLERKCLPAAPCERLPRSFRLEPAELRRKLDELIDRRAFLAGPRRDRRNEVLEIGGIGGHRTGEPLTVIAHAGFHGVAAFGNEGGIAALVRLRRIVQAVDVKFFRARCSLAMRGGKADSDAFDGMPGEACACREQGEAARRASLGRNRNVFEPGAAFEVDGPGSKLLAGERGEPFGDGIR